MSTSVSTRVWMDANLATQGYCLTEPDRRALRLGLRFSTGLCLTLTIGALIIGSPIVFVGLAVIGAFAGFGRRHPFDHLWNAVVRHLVAAPLLPPSPRRRRHGFKFATAMMLTVAALFALGASTPALVLGGLLVAACTAVTATNLCLPSVALSLLERRRVSAPNPTQANGWPRPVPAPTPENGEHHG